MKVIYTEHAHRQAAERRKWWRKHRAQKNGFTEEIKEADESSRTPLS